MKKLLFLILPLFIFADILEEIDRKLNPESYESYRKLINIEPDGTKKEFVLYSIKKGKEKVASLFLSPTSDRGRSTLRVGENMWLYMPGIAKPLRIASMQSVTGGVFNNSDILKVDYSVEYNLKSEKKDGDTTILELSAKNDTVAYEKLIMKLDKDILPKTIECYAGGILIKTLTYKNIQDFGNKIVRPAVIETTSPLQKGYISVMIFAKITPKELKDSYFTLDFLPKLEDIRK
jgi:outer membrane lipoprotein-sorting protein